MGDRLADIGKQAPLRSGMTGIHSRGAQAKARALGARCAIRNDLVWDHILRNNVTQHTMHSAQSARGGMHYLLSTKLQDATPLALLLALDAPQLMVNHSLWTESGTEDRSSGCSHLHGKSAAGKSRLTTTT